MKAIWSIVGILVIIIIIAYIYNLGAKKISTPVTSTTATTTVVPRPITEVKREVVIQPVFISTINCNDPVYKNNVDALWVAYQNARTVWQANNTITTYQALNDTYNAWYQEARKCNLQRNY